MKQYLAILVISTASLISSCEFDSVQTTANEKDGKYSEKSKNEQEHNREIICLERNAKTKKLAGLLNPLHLSDVSIFRNNVYMLYSGFCFENSVHTYEPDINMFNINTHTWDSLPKINAYLTKYANDYDYVSQVFVNSDGIFIGCRSSILFFDFDEELISIIPFDRILKYFFVDDGEIFVIPVSSKFLMAYSYDGALNDTFPIAETHSLTKRWIWNGSYLFDVTRGSKIIMHNPIKKSEEVTRRLTFDVPDKDGVSLYTSFVNSNGIYAFPYIDRSQIYVYNFSGECIKSLKLDVDFTPGKKVTRKEEGDPSLRIIPTSASGDSLLILSYFEENRYLYLISH